MCVGVFVINYLCTCVFAGFAVVHTHFYRHYTKCSKNVLVCVYIYVCIHARANLM